MLAGERQRMDGSSRVPLSPVIGACMRAAQRIGVSATSTWALPGAEGAANSQMEFEQADLEGQGFLDVAVEDFLKFLHGFEILGGLDG